MTSAPAAGPRRAPRLRALDFLRLLAALAVVGYHYTGVNTSYWDVPTREMFPGLGQVSRYGYLGVELFFVISGFVILMTAWGRTVPQFVASRVSRLYPAYWAAVVLTWLLMTLWSRGEKVPAIDALVNLTMLQQSFGIDHLSGAYWTLWVELKFYLLIATLMLVGMTRRRVIAFAVLWPVVGSIAAVTDSGVLNSLLILDYAPYFAGGMMLFLIHKEGHRLVPWLVLGLNVILALHQAVDYSQHRLPHFTHAQVSSTAVAIIILAIFASVALCSQGRLAQVDWKWLTVAGALTYPLYLIHGQLGFFLISTFHTELGRYPTLVLAFVMALVAAWLIHRLVEDPFHRRLRRSVERGLSSLTGTGTRAPSALDTDPTPEPVSDERVS